MRDKALSDRRIVILEDDYYQAEDCRHILEGAGATIIAISATVPDLAELLAKGPVDAALIDINLGGGHSFDFARELNAAGIPFAFLTGYDASILPDDLTGSACISKPADASRLIEVLASLLGDQALRC